MKYLPLSFNNKLGGKRLTAEVSLRDGRGALGIVSAVIDTGSPFTILFEKSLKKFRRLRPKKANPPQYFELGALSFSKESLGELSLGFKDNNQGLELFNHEVCAGILVTRGVSPTDFFDMIIGLDFIEQHKIVIDFIAPQLLIQ